MSSVPADQTGAATGMNASIRTIGGSIGAAVTSVLVTGRLQPSGPPYASGCTHGLALPAPLCLAAALAALLVPVRRSGRTTGGARATSGATVVEQETVAHG
ncbi:hypothetical protein ADK57_43430 [Streptomyces sp. MMG1533]|nr:hypothetical protein ADK57_43430 [Streptomyces sp. MMG1533]